MAATMRMRGHLIIYGDDKKWRYEDGRLAKHDRPCARCGCMPTKEGYDACVGFVEDAISFCCGHGIPGEKIYMRKK